MRIKHIDALRGIAAILVTFFHLTGSSGLSKLTATYGSYGFTGVEIFFVISGFVLPYSMFKTNYRLTDFKTFLLKRVIRIYPAYLVIALIGIIMAFITHRPIVPIAAIASHLLLLNSVLGYGWISVVFWTLAIEFQFYILIGLLYPIFSKSYIRSLLLIGTLIICAVLIKHLFFNAGAFITYWFPFFALGILIFNRKFNNMPLTVFLVTSLMLIAYIYFQFGLPETVAGCFAVLFILFKKFNAESMVIKLLLWFGKISYSLYLVHWELGRAGVSIAKHIPILGHNDEFRLFIGLIASILSAYLLYLFVEKPSIAHAHSVKYKHQDI